MSEEELKRLLCGFAAVQRRLADLTDQTVLKPFNGDQSEMVAKVLERVDRDLGKLENALV